MKIYLWGYVLGQFAKYTIHLGSILDKPVTLNNLPDYLLAIVSLGALLCLRCLKEQK